MMPEKALILDFYLKYILTKQLKKMKKTNIAAGLITCLFTATAMMNANAQSWSLNGNAGTTTNNFLGTTDAKALTIKTNNAKRITITSAGKVGVGTTNPTSRLHVFGGTNNGDTVPVILGLVKRTGNFDIVGVQGTSQPAPGFGIGVSGRGNFIGVDGFGDFIGVSGFGSIGVDGESAGADTTAANTGNLFGVQGIVNTAAAAIGVWGEANSGNFNYGVYGISNNGGFTDTAGSKHWAGFFDGDLFAVRFFQASDAYLKENIKPISSATTKLMELHPSTYNFKKTAGISVPSTLEYGLLAENVERVFPELVKEARTASRIDRNGKKLSQEVTFKSVNYIGLIPVLIESAQEQKQAMDQKDAQIAEQNAKIADLESKISQLASLMQQNGQITEQQKNAIVKSSDNAKLFQNQPNPVNGNSTIQVYLPSTVKSATLEITSAAGVVLKKITISERGNSQVIVDGADFASGNYTYSLLVDGKVIDSKTMIMTK